MLTDPPTDYPVTKETLQPTEFVRPECCYDYDNDLSAYLGFNITCVDYIADMYEYLGLNTTGDPCDDTDIAGSCLVTCGVCPMCTDTPADLPTLLPTRRPSHQPTQHPIESTQQPPRQPTRQPSQQPTQQPTEAPAESPAAVGMPLGSPRVAFRPQCHALLRHSASMTVR